MYILYFADVAHNISVMALEASVIDPSLNDFVLQSKKLSLIFESRCFGSINWGVKILYTIPLIIMLLKNLLYALSVYRHYGFIAASFLCVGWSSLSLMSTMYPAIVSKKSASVMTLVSLSVMSYNSSTPARAFRIVTSMISKHKPHFLLVTCYGWQRYCILFFSVFRCLFGW